MKYITKDNKTRGLSDEQYFKWFKDNTQEDGVVKEDILVFHEFETKALEDNKTQFVLSNYDKDRINERMDVTGADFKNYKKNPIVLWQHNNQLPPIGKMSGVKVDGKSLVGNVEFVSKEIDAAAWGIGERVRQGFLSKGSIGFIPRRVEVLESAKDGTRLIHKEFKLTEFSIVNVPALPTAGVKTLDYDLEKIKEYSDMGAEITIKDGGGDTTTFWDTFTKDNKQTDWFEKFKDTDNTNTNVEQIFNGGSENSFFGDLSKDSTNNKEIE